MNKKFIFVDWLLIILIIALSIAIIIGITLSNPLPIIQQSSSQIIKSLEMLDTIVHIHNPITGSGSGILIDCQLKAEKYHYIVLTNYHIIVGRLIQSIDLVDGLRGKLSISNVDPGCTVTVFSDMGKKWQEHKGTIMAELIDDDLALIEFESDSLFNIAKLASPKMMSEISMFDEVFSIGCQLGRKPIPTAGILSAFINDSLNFNSTAPITYGSSGGGLFKKYGDHYFVIGITDGAAIHNFNLIYHYAFSISMEVVYEFLQDNQLCDLIYGCQSNE